MRCKVCDGVIYGDVNRMLDRPACTCARPSPSADGISERLIRQYDVNADKTAPLIDVEALRRLLYGPDTFPFPVFSLGHTAEPTVPWQLTVEDKNLLRSMRIGVD